LKTSPDDFLTRFGLGAGSAAPGTAARTGDQRSSATAVAVAAGVRAGGGVRARGVAAAGGVVHVPRHASTGFAGASLDAASGALAAVFVPKDDLLLLLL
jgi:hypothetical protein